MRNSCDIYFRLIIMYLMLDMRAEIPNQRANIPETEFMHSSLITNFSAIQYTYIFAIEGIIIF